MNITLLSQGYDPASDNSVGQNLVGFLADKEFHSFTAITAFSRLAGVNGLSKHIEKAKNHLTSITIVTGVNQKGTTKEALEAILNLGISAYVFYAPKPFPIFHPKIYLFEGKQKSELIIGSSNLTQTGLYSNVETSLLISVNNNTQEDRKIIEQLKKYFKGIFNFNDPNLQKITNEMIEGFVKKKIVLTEAESKETRNKSESAETNETDDFISKIFPPRIASKIPSEFGGNKNSDSVSSVQQNTKIKFGKLGWVKQNLEFSDAQQKKSPTTKVTGNMKLSQGNFSVLGKAIDQTKYFREELFKNLNWQKTKINSATYEEADCRFLVTILDIDYGLHDLKISNDSVRVSNQNNTPTWLHWGKELGKVLQQINILGTTAKIFKSTTSPVIYKLVIEK